MNTQCLLPSSDDDSAEQPDAPSIPVADHMPQDGSAVPFWLRPATSANRKAQPPRAVCPDEFELLCCDGSLACLRELRSLGYTVSLLFHPATPAWYVACWQGGALWRVAMAAAVDTAQTMFAHLAGEILQLCEPELRRTELEARNAHLAHLIAQAEAEAARLRDSLQRAAIQSQLAATRQQKTRRDIVRLDAQRIAAQAQLTQTLRQTTQLRTAANNSCAPTSTRPPVSRK
ncbi:DUF2968 domain-containing protein [Paraburkholderia kururiensis]|jgi:hypothetical protein|uniref:DUF2968 domain-containing protein n=1 Tax=Paraburkholderia kururiensis TaxID=984307 RepID=UPI0018F6023E|nr:DUF2968 domain-containing protein [Paraburkholderia kururiensis]